MEARYAIALPDGTHVGFVTLPQPPKREHTVRIHPLPAFRVARAVRRRYRQFLRGKGEHHPLTEDDMLAEEQALGAVGDLEFHLVELPSGHSVLNAQVKLELGEPPRMRITFSGLSASE